MDSEREWELTVGGRHLLRTVALMRHLISFTQEVVLDCSHYFLRWARTRKGYLAKGVHEPGNAASHEDTETDEEGKDVSTHVYFWQEGWWWWYSGKSFR